jgi:hypothetical protein
MSSVTHIHDQFTVSERLFVTESTALLYYTKLLRNVPIGFHYPVSQLTFKQTLVAAGTGVTELAAVEIESDCPLRQEDVDFLLASNSSIASDVTLGQKVAPAQSPT